MAAAFLGELDGEFPLLVRHLDGTLTTWECQQEGEEVWQTVL